MNLVLQTEMDGEGNSRGVYQNVDGRTDEDDEETTEMHQ
jgi:hypothetical protein